VKRNLYFESLEDTCGAQDLTEVSWRHKRSDGNLKCKLRKPLKRRSSPQQELCPEILGHSYRCLMISFSFKLDAGVKLKKGPRPIPLQQKVFIQSDSLRQLANAFTAHVTESLRFQTPRHHPANLSPSPIGEHNIISKSDIRRYKSSWMLDTDSMGKRFPLFHMIIVPSSSATSGYFLDPSWTLWP